MSIGKMFGRFYLVMKNHFGFLDSCGTMRYKEEGERSHRPDHTAVALGAIVARPEGQPHEAPSREIKMAAREM